MHTERRAVIDVGTNSVKLLIADVVERQVQPVFETGIQTRLGRGLYEAHRLQPEPIAHTARVIADFAVQARAHHAVRLRAFATSAARDAVNAHELIAAVHKASGVMLEVISGEQEAEWAFQGASTDPRLANTPILLMDVGGGSTEFILGLGERKHFQQSFPLGAVRLLETIPHSDPPQTAELSACRDWLANFLERHLRPVLAEELDRELKSHHPHRRPLLVGTGGAATVLARIEQQLVDHDRERIEATQLSRGRVREWVNHLWSLPMAARRHLPGLPAERADVALTGAAIYEAVMESLRFDELRVTTRGLRFAAVLAGS